MYLEVCLEINLDILGQIPKTVPVLLVCLFV